MQDFGLLILRVLPAAIMVSTHGWMKLMGYSEMMHQFPDPIGFGAPVALSLAIFAEVVCSILLVLGIATRLAAIPLLITMLVAVVKIHAADGWAKQEFPALFAIIFLTLIFTGGGNYGLGNKFGARWMKSN